MHTDRAPEHPGSQVLINRIILDYIQEQKRTRRWRLVRKGFLVVLLVILIGILFAVTHQQTVEGLNPHVGLIDLNGSISDGAQANADDFTKGLDKAYKKQGLKALIIRINSPGGSPVQADYMFNSLRYYRTKYPDVKTYAVCVDMCASAAYYVAAAADEIYANPASMVGSIGVLYNGFGFVDTLQKLGITRRLQTSGVHKGFLDPFSPENPGDANILQTMLNEVHQQFIQRVKEGRGQRLKIDADTFSGLFWTGEQAKARGLIDGFASTGQLARDVIKLDKIIEYTSKRSMLERVSKNVGTAVADQLPLALGLRRGFQ